MSYFQVAGVVLGFGVCEVYYSCSGANVAVVFYDVVLGGATFDTDSTSGGCVSDYGDVFALVTAVVSVGDDIDGLDSACCADIVSFDEEAVYAAGFED